MLLCWDLNSLFFNLRAGDGRAVTAREFRHATSTTQVAIMLPKNMGNEPNFINERLEIIVERW